MKIIISIIALCVFSAAFATPKSDFYVAYQACVAANPDPLSAARQVCMQNAWFAYQAAVAAPAPTTKAKK